MLAAGFVACSSFGSDSASSPSPPATPSPPPSPPQGVDGSVGPDAAPPDAATRFCTTPAPSDELYCEDFDEGLPQSAPNGYGSGCNAPKLTTANSNQAIEAIKGPSDPDAGPGCASYYPVAIDAALRKIRVSLDARVVSSSPTGYIEFLNVRGTTQAILDASADAGTKTPAVALVVQNQLIQVEGPQGKVATVNPPPAGPIHYDLIIDLDAGPNWLTVSANGKKVTLTGLPATPPFTAPFTVDYGLPYADKGAALDVVIDNVRITTP